LEPEVWALVERPAVGLLADERDRPRTQLSCDALQSFGGTRKVNAPEVAGPPRRPVGRVRDADAEPGQLVLIVRREQPRREAGVVQEAPEVVARVGEVGAGDR
jgi:hypothetical protein